MKTRFIPLAATLFAVACAARATAGLEVSPREFRFGTVLAGDTVRRSFDVTNTGTEPVRLELQTRAPSDLNAKFPPELAPGKKGRLTVDWNTTGLKGAVEARLYLKTAGPTSSGVLVTLSGTIRPVLEVRPLTAALFSVYRNEPAERTLRVTSNAAEPVSLSPGELAGPHFRARLAPVESGRSYDLIVTVPAQTEPGRFIEAIELATTHPLLPQLRVPVGVLVKADLYANPETLDFGAVSAAALNGKPGLLDLLTQTVMVKKREGVFRIKSVESGVPCLRFRLDPSGPSQAFRLDVSLAVEALTRGDRSGDIRVLTDDPAYPAIVIPVRLTGK
ncbi:MAG TPA: DUF1573 domain-containing protein [Bryobacteraceae bacterium]|nr:DUF1573 domain-containing protein [Bryobacteraceae bacterium]